MWLLQFVLVITIFITGCFLVYFSVLSRRKQVQNEVRYRHRAWMNIFMGLCFLALAGLQLTIASEYFLRYVLIALIIVIGWINLYYGIKRYRWIKKNDLQKS